MNELNLKAADLDRVSGLDTMHQHIVKHSKLLEPLFRQSERESGAVNRKIELFEYIREGTDVVFVPVCEDYRRQVVSIFLEKIEIRYRNIDSVRRFFGKAHAGVHYDHLVAVPDAHAVHPELTDAAERYYFDLAHLNTVKIDCNTSISGRIGSGPARQKCM